MRSSLAVGQPLLCKILRYTCASVHSLLRKFAALVFACVARRMVTPVFLHIA